MIPRFSPPAVLAVALLALLSFGVTPACAADSEPPQYYELRIYSTSSPQQLQRINDYWEDAAVPAYQRHEIGPIGVFTELEDVPARHVYVLIPFDTPGAYAAVPDQLSRDAVYQAAAASYLDTPKTDPAYVRFQSSLLVAFDGMKQLAVPPSAAAGKPWIFELRTYQSHSERKGDNKVRMFNSGEISLMKEVGLSPVFFGQSVIGADLPNLTYMVSGETREAHQTHWKAFFDAPVWKKLLADSQYRDNVSKVDSVFLKRMAASQI